ncbi:MAG: 30S ribosomal protein S6 [Bauldia sp.]|nr:30S ribosomal protein S6 [Bauldia sp.]
MPLYEHVVLARQDVSGQQVEALVDQMKSVLTENGGTVGRVEFWGLKSLTYRIRKNRKAHYALLNIDAPAAALAEMERQLSLNEDVLRFLTVRVDEHETEPSAMMQKRDRDDRGDRGGRDDRGGRGGFGGGGRDRDRGGRDRPRREEGAEESE